MTENKTVPRSDAPTNADRLRRAKESADRINKATEALNTRILEAEELLQGMNVGVEVIIPLYENANFEQDGQLAFAKHGNQWRLLWFPEDETPFSGHKPMEVVLLSAPREVRVAAALRLGDLVSELLEKSESHLAEIHSAVAALDRVCDTLGGRQR